MRLLKVSMVGIVIGIVVGICLACVQVLPASIGSASEDVSGGQTCACCVVSTCLGGCPQNNYKVGVAGSAPDICSCSTNSTNPCWESGAPPRCSGYEYYEGDKCGEGNC